MSYTLVRSSRRKKTLCIQVDSGGTVTVRVPARTPPAEIDRFLAGKGAWLKKTLDRLDRDSRDLQVHAFTAGERFPYLGREYALRIAAHDNAHGALLFTGRDFVLRPEARAEARRAFEEWYRRQARLYFQQRVRRIGGRLGLEPAGVSVGDARSRWGSCSPGDRLRFSWRLLLAPPDIIDYVVVHELCHMRIRNHSHRYWRLVERAVPDYRQHRAWLREHGRRLQL